MKHRYAAIEFLHRPSNKTARKINKTQVGAAVLSSLIELEVKRSTKLPKPSSEVQKSRPPLLLVRCS